MHALPFLDGISASTPPVETVSTAMAARNNSCSGGVPGERRWHGIVCLCLYTIETTGDAWRHLVLIRQIHAREKNALRVCVHLLHACERSSAHAIRTMCSRSVLADRTQGGREQSVRDGIREG